MDSLWIRAERAFYAVVQALEGPEQTATSFHGYLRVNLHFNGGVCSVQIHVAAFTMPCCLKTEVSIVITVHIYYPYVYYNYGA